MDTVYPFIPKYPNGQPQGNFLVNGLSAPVLIPKRAASCLLYTSPWLLAASRAISVGNR